MGQRLTGLLNCCADIGQSEFGPVRSIDSTFHAVQTLILIALNSCQPQTLATPIFKILHRCLSPNPFRLQTNSQRGIPVHFFFSFFFIFFFLRHPLPQSILSSACSTFTFPRIKVRLNPSFHHPAMFLRRVTVYLSPLRKFFSSKSSIDVAVAELNKVAVVQFFWIWPKFVYQKWEKRLFSFNQFVIVKCMA